MSNRGERREEIKLILEYVKVVFSLVGVATIIFAGLQWRAANHVADQATYQRMATEWRDHLKTFVEKPDLRPYFESKKQLNSDDQNAQAVLALADVRLDVADAVLTYAAQRGFYAQIGGWERTFASAFRTSPVLCSRLSETSANYGLIVPIGRTACGNER